MEQRIGDAGSSSEVGRFVQERRKRMIPRESFKACDEVVNLGIRPTDSDASTVLLKHVDAGTSVRRVDHQVHCAGVREHVVQSAQTSIRVGKVVQNAGADDMIEGLSEFGNALDSNLVHFEIFERVLLLQLFRKRDALCADIDPDYLRTRPTHSVVRSLDGSAARD
jgi:hypothetical protein